MQARTRKKFRKLVKSLKWTKTRSWLYRDAPHEYCWWEEAPVKVLKLTLLIREHGERKRWRKTERFKFLHIGDLIYWEHEGAINRTYAVALDRGGYPGPAARAKIQKRFGWKKK